MTNLLFFTFLGPGRRPQASTAGSLLGQLMAELLELTSGGGQGHVVHLGHHGLQSVGLVKGLSESLASELGVLERLSVFVEFAAFDDVLRINGDVEH